MARTTSNLVEGIIDVDAGDVLTPFINVANLLVTQCCTGTAVSTAYPAATLVEIETWLAAHFYTVKEGRAIKEKAASVSETKQSKVDLGFSTSHYGQMAMTIDFQGGLASLNQEIIKGKTKIASVTGLGMTRTEFDDYIDNLP